MDNIDNFDFLLAPLILVLLSFIVVCFSVLEHVAFVLFPDNDSMIPPCGHIDHILYQTLIHKLWTLLNLIAPTGEHAVTIRVHCDT